jgi:hypothetical protein
MNTQYRRPMGPNPRMLSLFQMRHINGTMLWSGQLVFIPGQFESSCRRIFVYSVYTSLCRTAKLKHLEHLLDPVLATAKIVHTTGSKLATLVLTVVQPLHSLFKLQTQVPKDLRSRSKPTLSVPQLVVNTERIGRVRREPDRCQGESNKFH